VIRAQHLHLERGVLHEVLELLLEPTDVRLRLSASRVLPVVVLEHLRQILDLRFDVEQPEIRAEVPGDVHVRPDVRFERFATDL
jgi:hypothetical protein